MEKNFFHVSTLSAPWLKISTPLHYTDYFSRWQAPERPAVSLRTIFSFADFTASDAPATKGLQRGQDVGRRGTGGGIKKNKQEKIFRGCGHEFSTPWKSFLKVFPLRGTIWPVFSTPWNESADFGFIVNFMVNLDLRLQGMTFQVRFTDHRSGVTGRRLGEETENLRSPPKKSIWAIQVFKKRGQKRGQSYEMMLLRFTGRLGKGFKWGDAKKDTRGICGSCLPRDVPRVPAAGDFLASFFGWNPISGG